MNKDYIKFLGQKLFLIEALSLKNWLSTGNEIMKEIHDICIFTLPELETYVSKETEDNENSSETE